MPFLCFFFLLALLLEPANTKLYLQPFGGQTLGQYLAQQRAAKEAGALKEVQEPQPKIQVLEELLDWSEEERIDDPCSEEVMEEEDAENRQEVRVRMVIVLGMSCLLGMYVCGFFLDYHGIIFIPEAGAGIIIGIIVSFLVHQFMNGHVNAMVKFDPEFFFIFLLPPIMFEAGYNMDRTAFFRNIGGICAYAFIGTTISCFAVGGIIYGLGRAGACYPLGGLASLVFGALISATDPVSVLAVFQKLKADVDLYSLVFGESVLNDAVAIVLYRTLIAFKCSISGTQVAFAFINFIVIFAGSTFVGVAIAALSALVMKHCPMREEEEFFFYEMTILACFPYIAFMFGEALSLSGIVSILFCGIGMSHYTYDNLSPAAQDTSRKFFKILASLTESFIFIYLGMAVFTFPQTWNFIIFLLVAIFACLVARFFNIYPVSLVINCCRTSDKRINQKCQFIAWFSGLRGAMAFLIAVQQWGRQDFPQVSDPKSPDYTDSDYILSTTLFIAIITVFTMGGPMGFLLTFFDLRQKEEAGGGEPAQDGAPQMLGLGISAPMPAVGSIYVDRKYFKPLLTIRQWDEESGNCYLPGQMPKPTEMEDLSLEMDVSCNGDGNRF